MPSKSLSILLFYSGFRLSATFVMHCYEPESDFNFKCQLSRLGI